MALSNKLGHFLSARGPILLRDLASLVSGQLFGMLLGFVSFAYLARVLDPEAYGALEYAIAVTSFAAIVIECGVGTIGVREVVRDPARAPTVAAQASVARGVIALLVVPVAGLSAQVAGYQDEAALLVWLYAFSLFAAPFKQDWLLQGLERMSLAALAQAVRMAVFAGLVFALVRREQDLALVGGIEVAALFAMTAYFLMAQYVSGAPFRYRPSLSEPLRLLREGATVGLSNIVWAFKLYMPMFLLTWLVGGEQPAWLGASHRITISLLTLSFVYHFNLYPVIARTVDRAPEVWQRLMSSSFRLVAWVAIGVGLFFAVCGRPVMMLVYGETFAAAAPVIAAMIWLFPVRVLSGHTRWALIAAGKQHLLLLSELLGAAVLLVSSFGLIPLLEAQGAAASVVLGIAASGLMTQYYAETRLGRLHVTGHVALPAGLALLTVLGGNLWLDDLPLFTELPFASELRGALLAVIVYGGGLAWLSPRLLADLKQLAYAKSRREVAQAPEPAA